MKDCIDANNKANAEVEKQFKAKRAEVLKKELVRLGKELQKLTAE